MGGERVDKPIKTPIPLVRQGRNYTCGLASLEAVNEAFGTRDEGELEIAEHAGSTPEAGTDPNSLQGEAERLGLKSELHENLTLDQLKGFLDQEKPVICAIQAWGEPENYGQLDDGHYVVAIGYDDENIYFEDPSMEGHYGYLPNEEFLARWRDKEDDGEIWNRSGLVLWREGVELPDEPVGETEKIGTDLADLPILQRARLKGFPRFRNKELQQWANVLSLLAEIKEHARA